MRTRLYASVAALALLAGGTAAADDGRIITAANPEDIVEIARGFGSAELSKDSQGDPKIIGRIDGTRYFILFYGCDQGRDCDDIQFRTAWSAKSITLEAINKWNYNKRFAKAYLDKDNDPVLEMPVNIDFGVTRRNIEDTFDWWSIALRDFKKTVLNQ